MISPAAARPVVQHYHLVARNAYGHRRLIATARSADLARGWYDRWGPYFEIRGELLTLNCIAGTHADCAGRWKEAPHD